MLREKIDLLLLFLIIFFGFIVRLYRFDNPIADWHAWRQADTSAVSRNFVRFGFDVLHPRFDDLSNVPSGIDNPKGYRFVEFPLYNVVQAGLFVTFGIFTLEQWGRLVTIVASLLSATILFFLVRKHFGEIAGVLTAFFFTFLPFNIYFSRTILPDPSMVSAILGGIYFFDKWISKDSKLAIARLDFFLGLCLTAVAFLLKPFALFFTLPMVYLVFNKFGLRFYKKWQLWIFLIIGLIPLGLWRLWITQYPEGIPGSSWLFNGGNIRFKPAFFYWLFADRIGRLILGYWGLVLLGFGLTQKAGKNYLFFTFLLSSLVYLFVIARGNVQHDYYQILIMPTIAIFLGLGSNALLKLPGEYFHKISCYILVFVAVVFMFSFGWYFVRDYFNINNEAIVTAGKAIDALTPKNAKIIAPYNGDTSFLYQTKRQGWASFEKPLPEMVSIGADYLVLVNPSNRDYDIGKTYKIVSATPQYILFDLRQKP